MLPPDPMVPLTITIPSAVAAVIILACYWRSTYMKSVERSRRRIRRANTLVQYALIIALVYALSMVRPAYEKQQFILAWMTVLLFVTVMIVLAGADAINTVRIRRRKHAQDQTSDESE